MSAKSVLHLKTTVAASDFLGGFCGENKLVILTADSNICAAFCIHLLALLCSSCDNRIIDLLVPAGDGVVCHTGIAFGDFCLSRMIAAGVCLVAGKDRTFDGRSGEGNADFLMLYRIRKDYRYSVCAVLGLIDR